jgi:hypothetical protein
VNTADQSNDILSTDYADRNIRHKKAQKAQNEIKDGSKWFRETRAELEFFF